jgi:5-methylcytosine-specific restriction protein A
MTLRFCLPRNAHHPRGQVCPKQQRRANTRRKRSKGERLRRQAVIAQHVAQHGYVCPGYDVPAHPSSDLTADHIQPVARGGSEEGGALQVLCRSCNGRRGHGHDEIQALDHPAPAFRERN